MEIGKKIKAGDIRAASRLIRDIEDSIPEAKFTIKHIFPYTGKAQVVGITGSPGAGKSTLVDGLVEANRKRNRTVGVLAVDPTSPFTGGATLGDRIRMQRHAEDPGVFIRSLATRGSLGGLSKAVGDAIHVMDAMGKDIILVETVGTGQQEVEIINYAHTVIVVLVPGMGDEIQAIKAGIMEIADIFVVNKSDREGAGKLQRELMAMLDMSPVAAGGWRPPIVTIGNSFKPEEFEQDIGKLSARIHEHYEFLVSSDLIGDRLRRKTMHELNEALRSSILEPVLNMLVSTGELDRMVEKLLKKESDPCSLAEEVARKYLQECI
ncbi:MAG: methylmalonyl Co-A mutase-associated GTPase MeaB [Deltaproteobacteria bacterium]|nr:methylmalonyl Co-A mutase-associated GTPase MeaB [Deltaproteobacteria bacterium]